VHCTTDSNRTLRTLRLRHKQVMCSRMRLSGSFDYSAIAKKTPGYVGADLSSLTKEAAVVAINRIFR
jgi:ribosome biogenesis ATPase